MFSCSAFDPNTRETHIYSFRLAHTHTMAFPFQCFAWIKLHFLFVRLSFVWFPSLPQSARRIYFFTIDIMCVCVCLAGGTRSMCVPKIRKRRWEWDDVGICLSTGTCIARAAHPLECVGIEMIRNFHSVDSSRVKRIVFGAKRHFDCACSFTRHVGRNFMWQLLAPCPRSLMCVSH